MKQELPDFWAADITPGDTKAEDERWHNLVAALPTIKALRARLRVDLTAAESKRDNLSYANPSWACEQADLNGKIKYIKRMLDNLEIL